MAQRRAVTQKHLKPVLDKKSELSAVERRFEALQNERNAIAADHQRLRENMKALLVGTVAFDLTPP